MSARELITEHLDLWTGAVTKKSSSGRGSNGKVELTGVKKLRELILELAVRGKLVEQIAGDVPAQELIGAISDLRQQKIREGALPKPKMFKPDTEHVPEYDVPNLWTLTPLGHLTLQITDGVHHTPKYLPSGVPFISVKDIDGRSVSFRDCKYISEEQHKEINKRCNPERGDILLCRIGTLGRATIVDTDTTFSLFVSVGLLKMPTTLISSRYVHLALHSPFSLQQMDQIKAGGSHTNKLNLGAIPTLHIPVPPMEEQQRIVEKVDELMALCDRLEQQTVDQLEAHETLVDTLLGTLTQSENATELADNWTRLAAHFDTLFTTEQSIDKLKQTILQLAVMGRLVEQDAGDEPGSALVARMLETRDHLATNEGMKTKAGNEVPSNEMYLSAPNSWAWVRLGNMAKFIDYRGKTPTKTGSGKRLITAKNIRQGYIDLEPEEFISEEDYTKWMTRGFPRKGDLLFTPEAPLGNAAIVDLNEEFALAQRAICFQWHLLDTSRFMLIQIMASPFQTKLVENATGMTATGIKASKLKEIPVAIPPLKEQHRIVQKVDELMTLCDQLKKRLNEASKTRCQLAESVVEGALKE